MTVFPGQRYSVVVTANQTVGNYWIRASADLLNRTFEGGLNSAILRYEGANNEDPTTEEGPYDLEFNESLLVTLDGAAVPGTPEVGKADVNLNLIPGHIGELFNINNVSFVDPAVPILLQILSGATHASQLLPNGSVYELPPNKVIELSFPATDGLVNGAVGGPVSESKPVERSADLPLHSIPCTCTVCVSRFGFMYERKISTIP